MVSSLRNRIAALLLAALAAAFCAAAARADDRPPTPLRAFYFGNSLTGCTNPQWHEALGRSAGREWTNDVFLGAGWQLWQHREELKADEAVFSRDSKGDLTIDPEFAAASGHKPKRFYQGEWDAIVMQSFAAWLTQVVEEKWGRKFDEPTDCGDLAAATDIARLYLKINPKGRVYVYQVWPAMKAGRVPPDDELPAWAVAMKAKRGSIRAAEFPDREGFDYRAQWAKTFVPSDRPWIEGTTRTRDFNAKLFEGLKDNLPELWEDGRLRMIPAGDLFLALDEKMRAGQVPGITTIKDFYTDVQHTRAGLPRYTAAALFYACLFEEHPGRLDASIYNDREAYGPDPHHDKGELLEITPERRRIVDETIWQVITSHPYTGMSREE